MKRAFFYLGLTVAIAVCVILVLKKRPHAETSPITTGLAPTTASNIVGNIIERTNQSQVPTKKQYKLWIRPSGVDDAGWAYMLHIRELLMQENQPVEFYARVLDQNDKPVESARLELHLDRIDEDKVASQEFLHMNMGAEQMSLTNIIYSDANGRMQLRGITGTDLTVWSLSKEGYTSTYETGSNYMLIRYGIREQQKPESRRD